MSSESEATTQAQEPPPPSREEAAQTIQGRYRIKSAKDAVEKKRKAAEGQQQQKETEKKEEEKSEAKEEKKTKSSRPASGSSSKSSASTTSSQRSQRFHVLSDDFVAEAFESAFKIRLSDIAAVFIQKVTRGFLSRKKTDPELHERKAKRRRDERRARMRAGMTDDFWYDVLDEDISIYDHRTEEEKEHGKKMFEKYWPIGPPTFTSAQFAKAFLQTTYEFERREESIRRLIERTIEQDHVKYWNLLRKYFHTLCEENADAKRRLGTREGRYRGTVEEEEQVHRSAITQLWFAELYGEEWAEAYRDLVSELAELEKGLRKDISKEEINKRVDMCCLESNERHDIILSKFNRRPPRGGTSPNKSSTTGSPVRMITDSRGEERSVSRSEYYRPKSSMELTRDLCTRDSGFSLNFDDSLVNLHAKRELQRIQYQSDKAQQANEIRQENSYYQQMIDQLQVQALTRNFAKAVKQRDETKAHRKQFNIERKKQLDQLRERVHTEQLASKRAVHDMRNPKERNVFTRLLAPIVRQEEKPPMVFSTFGNEPRLLSASGLQQASTLSEKLALEREQRRITPKPHYSPDDKYSVNQQQQQGSSASGQRKGRASPSSGEPNHDCSGAVSRGAQTPGDSRGGPQGGASRSNHRLTTAELRQQLDAVAAQQQDSRPQSKLSKKMQKDRNTASSSGISTVPSSHLEETMNPAEQKLYDALLKYHVTVQGGTTAAGYRVEYVTPDSQQQQQQQQQHSSSESGVRSASSSRHLRDKSASNVSPLQLTSTEKQKILELNQDAQDRLREGEVEACDELLTEAKSRIDKRLAEVRQKMEEESDNNNNNSRKTNANTTTSSSSSTFAALSSTEKELEKLLVVTLNNLACHARAVQRLRLAVRYLQQVMAIEERVTGSATVASYLNVSAVLNQLDEGFAAVHYGRRAVELLTDMCLEDLTAINIAEQDESVGGCPPPNGFVVLKHKNIFSIGVSALHNVSMAQASCDPDVSALSAQERASTRATHEAAHHIAKNVFGEGHPFTSKIEASRAQIEHVVKLRPSHAVPQGGRTKSQQSSTQIVA